MINPRVRATRIAGTNLNPRTLSGCCFAGGGNRENKITDVTRTAIDTTAAARTIRNALIAPFLLAR